MNEWIGHIIRRRIVKFMIAGAVLTIGTIQRGHAEGNPRNLIPEVRIDQDDINAGMIDFVQLFFTGKHIFSNRFTSEDGYGEDPTGPRRSMQALAGRPNLPFLRFNGLDAQVCQECHSLIGFNQPNSNLDPLKFMDELGATGGSAGSVANAFGFSNFPISTLGFVRNPPHVFGVGYTQRLAEEMSEDLMLQRDDAIRMAMSSGERQTINLTSKGVDFGTITVDSDATVDTSGLDGVSEDLVVRPFAWKGLASTARNFDIDALNFHFSIQAKELLDRGVIPNDNDAIDNEILEGEVSALSVFVAFMRPPENNTAGLDEAKVARGRMVFDEVSCADCHRGSLTIEDPNVTIIDPRVLLARIEERKAAGIIDPATPERPTLINGEKSSEDLAVVKQYQLRTGQLRQSSKADDATHPKRRLDGFTRSLNLSGPIETMPRLPFDAATGRIEVPLYSDLKRHKMGAGLAESFIQQTDGAVGVTVAGDAFLTRPLWGVGDTQPWMHDGRALTLEEAIEMHAGDGGEANDSVALFDALSRADKDALLEFLRSLRLPAQPFVETNEARQWSHY